MKKKIRLLVRRILKIKDRENIKDGILRHKFNFFKQINKKEYNLNQFENALKECGIKNSDTIFIQSSWRAFVGFDATPQATIESIKKITGLEGTVLMPSFGYSNDKINIEEDKTSLGVLAEEFRKYEGTNRSLDSYFPICANGKNANLIINKHIESDSPFDENSPFSKLLDMDGKLVFLGLGRYPYKVSFIHFFMNRISKINGTNKKMFNQKLECKIINKNKIIEKNIFVRDGKYMNDNKNIKKAMKIVDHKYRKLGFLDIYVCGSQDLMTILKKMDIEGVSFYKVRRSHA